MPTCTVTAETIASWEAAVGPSPIHGLGMELSLGSAIEPHRHHRGQMMTAPAGVITVKIAGVSYVVAENRGLWVPKGIPHEVFASTEVKMRNLQIVSTLAPSLPDKVCMFSVSPLFKELMGSAIEGEQWVRKGSREEKILELLVLEFRVANDFTFTFPEPRDIRLKRICAALRDNPGDNRSLTKWSEIAGGCTRTLGRLFYKETGLTFAQWRRQLRLHDAVVRLHRGQPVTSIAYDAGYENPSSFIEMFRRMTGRTPGQFLDG
jgi:AraC-like DNA-binding protein